ncbi:beta strand repeat-containing protein [Arsenicibacter rosenii]|nr:hypothetical protein [Arsenicibacter rosenii]
MSKFDGTGTQNTLGTCGGGSPALTLTPASATYTEGQNVTVSVSNLSGNTGTNYGVDLTLFDDDFTSFPFTIPAGLVVPVSGTFVATIGVGAAGSTLRKFLIYESGNGGATVASSSGFYIIPCPSLTVTATPSFTIGSGQNVTLTAAAVGQVVSPVVFQWQGQPVSSTYAISNLTGSNTYSVTGTTGNCRATTTATVSVTTAFNLTTTAGSSNLCVGATTTLSVSAAGGTAPYSYTWTAPAGVSITAGGSSSVVSVSMLTSGTKTFTVTVAGSGGSPVSTTTIGITGYALPTPGITVSPGLTFCSGASITLTATGAGAAGSYYWSTTEQSSAISVSLGQLYSVTVISSANCQSTTSVTTVRRSLPTATVSALPSLTVCPGQSLTLTANGLAGAPEAQGGARVANVLAPAGLTYNWSTGSNAASTILTPGSSTVISLTVSDGYCSTSAISTSVVVRNPVSVSITVPASPTLTCSQTNLSLTAVAGNGSTYRWDDNSTNATRVVSASGVYSVTATEGGCSTTATTSVSSNTTAPSLSISGNLTICQGGTTTLTASGAGAGGSYTWDLPASTSAISVSLGNTYSVTGVASNGCRSTTGVTVTVIPAVTATISGNLTVCQGMSTTLTAGGGTSALWSDNFNGLVNTVSPQSTTPYTVTVSSGGCSATATATVTVNPAVTATVSGNLTICAGQSTTLTATGGNSFQWSDNVAGSANVVSPVSTTAYSVTVSNTTTGCSASTTVTVTVNPAVTATVSGNLTICAGQSTTLTAAGGNSFQWSNSAGNAVNEVTPASTTVYSVTVSNTTTGCFAPTSVTVTVNAAVTASISQNQTICSGKSATLTAGGGSTYRWSDNVANATNIVSPVSTTAYSVTVSSGNCSATAIATVTVNTSPTVSIAASSTSLTGGQSATLTASGADSYTWSTPSNATAITVSPVTTTVYSVSGTQNGCLGEASTTVSVSCVDAIARAISVTLASALGPGNCTVSLQGQGTGSSFIFTGPGGYVFSTVYRRTGTYSLNAVNVTQPGTYTMTARATNACGKESVDTITYVVTGTACP